MATDMHSAIFDVGTFLVEPRVPGGLQRTIMPYFFLETALKLSSHAISSNSGMLAWAGNGLVSRLPPG